MKILVVSYYDDNYGDMLIRISFISLLKTVLKNLGRNESEYEIRSMSLKVIDEELIRDSDWIFFAGGGLFGLSYLDFYRFVDRITDLAQECEIPVVFSSMGVNNMDACPENDHPLTMLLQKSCIRAISVRENLKLFQSYCQNDAIEIRQVCDPAVWTRYLYAKELPKRIPHEKPVIGINVVRGGLFRDNGYDWGISDEIRYLDEIRLLLEAAGLDYRFYTNGSMLDNNTLRYFAREKQIDPQKVIYHQTTRELVHTISGFDAVLAIRLHSSIIAYSFGIPTWNLIWNDKIPLFYESIGRPEYAIRLEDWKAEALFDLLRETPNHQVASLDPSYAMTVYQFLFDTLKKLTKTTAVEMFSFDQVVTELEAGNISLEEDLTDLYRKVLGCERKYLLRFTELREKEAEWKELKKQWNKSEKERMKTQEQLERMKEKQSALELRQKETEKKLKETTAAYQKAQSSLDHILHLLPIRVYRKIKQFLSPH